MPDDLPFLRAIFHRPDDDGLRLVYADWLDDRGDPRAEFVRLDVERHHLAPGAETRRAAVEQRLSELGAELDARWVGLLREVRNLSPGARLDLAVVADGKGLIDVRGGEAETVLLVEGKPVALNWDDCAGSVGQYLVYTGHTGGSEYVRQLTEFVAGDVEDDRPLADQIEPLLALFAPGTYGLHYTPSTVAESIGRLDHPGRPSAAGELAEYYPYDRNLVGTQPRESLDEGRVAFFREQIRAGRRPIVLTAAAEGAWCEFVIDGHHKLEAYTREQVRPAVLELVRWDAPAIRPDEGLGYLPPGHPGAAEYRRMKG